jgi:hypothetical protein
MTVARSATWCDGKSRAENDCLIGLVGYSDDDLQPINRKGMRVGLVCTDGDPICDHDGKRNAVCEFRIGLFLRKSGHASCNPAAARPARMRARARAGAVYIDLLARLGLPSEGGMDYVSDLTSFPGH